MYLGRLHIFHNDDLKEKNVYQQFIHLEEQLSLQPVLRGLENRLCRMENTYN